MMLHDSKLDGKMTRHQKVADPVGFETHQALRGLLLVDELGRFGISSPQKPVWHRTAYKERSQTGFLNVRYQRTDAP
jgi:hypothetical protein